MKGIFAAVGCVVLLVASQMSRSGFVGVDDKDMSGIYGGGCYAGKLAGCGQNMPEPCVPTTCAKLNFSLAGNRSDRHPKPCSTDGSLTCGLLHEVFTCNQ